MRVMWHSNAAWCGSGYGVQTAHAVELLKKMGHDVCVSASFGLDGNALNMGGVLTLPGNGSADPYGAKKAPANGRMWKADVLVTLLDAWVFHGEAFAEAGQRWVCLAPIDHEPIPERNLRPLREAWWAAGFAPSSIKLMREAGLDPLYIPHAYDPTALYRLTDAERVEARERLGIPTDAFTVGVVAANKGTPSRKNLPAIIEAFGGLLAKHPDSVLVLHTEMDQRHAGINVFAALEFFGIPESAVRYSDQERPSQTPAHMNALYNSIDVLVNPAAGEGYGVPILEAQATGCVPIVGDWTAMADVAAPEARRIPKLRSLRVFTLQESFQWLAPPAAILDELEAAYREKGTAKGQRRSDAVRRHAYDLGSLHAVEPLWREAFAKIEQRIADEGALAQPDAAIEVIREDS